MAGAHSWLARLWGAWLFGCILAPVLLGLLGTLLASVSYFPAIGALDFSIAPWREFWTYPALYKSIFSTWAAAIIALALALPIALFTVRKFHNAAPKWMLIILAAPHSAVAIGFAFLIAPSGWLMRVLGSLMGWQSPPAIITINDPFGIALGLGLALKELPFLIVVAMGVLPSLPLRSLQKTAASLGYDAREAWLKLIIPQLLPLIRLPIFIAFVYALTNVDMALILGPSGTPTLPILITRWFHDPDLQSIFLASVGAIVLIVFVGVSAVVGFVLERIFLGQIVRSATKGDRISLSTKVMSSLAYWRGPLIVFAVMGLAANLVWSFTWRWSFPNIWPETMSLKIWGKVLGNGAPTLLDTASIAFFASGVSLIFALIWLEISRAKKFEKLFLIPLFMPQLSFLFGFDAILYQVRIPPYLAVVWTHVIFTFPYMLILLSEPWRDISPALLKTARALGKSELTIFLRVKLPLALAPVCLAFGVGVAVSIAQYLPTLFAGRGRIETITTEAITLASGSDLRLTSAFAFLQLVIPVIAFGLALLIPRVLFRNRRALLGES